MATGVLKYETLYLLNILDSLHLMMIQFMNSPCSNCESRYWIENGVKFDSNNLFFSAPLFVNAGEFVL